jgi:hypothetical protein
MVEPGPRGPLCIHRRHASCCSPWAGGIVLSARAPLARTPPTDGCNGASATAAQRRARQREREDPARDGRIDPMNEQMNESSRGS